MRSRSKKRKRTFAFFTILSLIFFGPLLTAASTAPRAGVRATTGSAAGAPQTEYKFDSRLSACYDKINLLTRHYLSQDNDHAYQYLGGGAFARGPLAADDQKWHLAMGDRELQVDMKTGACSTVSESAGGITMQKFVAEKLATSIRAFRAQLEALKESGSDAVVLKAGLEKFEKDIKDVLNTCQSVPKNETGEGVPPWLMAAASVTRQALRPLSADLHSGLGGPSTAPPLSQ